MPIQKPIFIEDKIYHVYNRGVEKREIFLDDTDYFRFIHDLFEFNDQNYSSNINYYFDPKTMEIGTRYIKKKDREPRKLLVEILIFTLMPNHFHLMLRQKTENGITTFMQKLGIGYAMYFNKKYERVGSLFQGKFRAIDIVEHAHFLHLPYYLHLNPLELINYQDRNSIDYKSMVKFLENYRWSSFLDYIGKKNFPSVTQRDFLLDFFDGEEEYKKETVGWLKEKQKNLENIREITLE